MSTTLERAGHCEQLRHGAGLEARVGAGVLRVLGVPDNFHAVKVRWVFGSKYRVNVYVRVAAGTFEVAHSYFVEADGDGAVVASCPPITRLY
jgi:hypothetical protein